MFSDRVLVVRDLIYNDLSLAVLAFPMVFIIGNSTRFFTNFIIMPLGSTVAFWMSYGRSRATGHCFDLFWRQIFTDVLFKRTGNM